VALPTAAIDHYRTQQLIGVLTAERVDELWRTMTDDFDMSWGLISREVFETVLSGQREAARTGLAYVPRVLAEQDIDAPAAVEVNPERFVGGTDDGRPVETLLHGAVYQAKTAVGEGASTVIALASSREWLQGVVLDVVRDVNRQAVSAGMAARPKVGGWVRMLNPPSCKFCITLAGKYFRWNQGFASHPHCDCRHIPTSETVAGDLTIDPYAYFNQLDETQQNRLFGKNDAQALRDGGDIYRVVNTRSRGLADHVAKSTPGRNRGWQSRRWDSPSLMTIDDVYRVAKNRDDAIRLMEANGFITGEQVAGGNLRGNVGTGYAGALGRGGSRKGATAAYQKAVRSGQRDLLEPATQTAAERRLHSAVLVKAAVDQGRNPFGTSPLTAADAALAQREYRRQLERLNDAPESVRALARLLGVL
jgi:hypothetical protein